MAEFPALNLWTDAYLSDTRHLSTLEHGAYLLLLMEAWRRPNCDLPDDDRILARLAGLTPGEWTDIRDIILAFWTLDGRSKTWRQKRLLKERDVARKRSRSQSDKAAKRWNIDKKENAAALPSECPDDASTTTTTTIEEPNGSSSPHVPPADKPKSAKVPKVAMTSDWEPGDLTGDVGDMLAVWPPGRLNSELADFREYWIENGERRPGWDRTFRRRIRDIHDRVMRDSRYGNDHRQANGGPAAGHRRPQHRVDGTTAAINGMLEEARSRNAAAPAGRPDDGDGARDRDLLPARRPAGQ